MVDNELITKVRVRNVKSILSNVFTSSGGTITNGNGTTANGTAVDLGGVVSSPVVFTGTSSMQIGDDSVPLSAIFGNGGIDTSLGQTYFEYSSTGNYIRVSKLFGTYVVLNKSIGHYQKNTSNDWGFHYSFQRGGDAEKLMLSFVPTSSTTWDTILNLGSDAIGDTYYRNSSGYFTRLPVGTDGNVLTLAAGIPSWAAPSGGSGLTVGTTTITSGTNTRVLYNNSGVLGEYTVSGSGNVAMTTSPTFTTPILGTPTSGTLTNTTGYLFNNLAAATGSATINNAANAIEWQWNTLGAGTGLLLSSSSTAAASNTNTVFRVNQTGANATSTQTTYGGYFSNTKTGTSSTNVGLHAVARGGTTNYAGTFDGIIGQYDGSGGNFNYMQVVSGSWRMRAASSFYVYTGNNPPFIVDTRKVTIGFSSGSGSGETQSLETNSGAWPSIPSTTELSDIIFNTNGATWTWDAGTTTTQRFNWFKGHTVNGGTLTNAYQLYVDAPIVGTGTITNNYAAGFGGNVLISGTRVNIANLPTSAAGLATGDLWNNSGVINIV